MKFTRETRTNRIKLLTLLIAGSLASGQAMAQQAAKADPKKDDDKLETIVVTATKRSESLQQVPVAVSVLSGDDLEKSNLNNMSTITQQMPTVNFRANASNKDMALIIRGLGTIATGPAVEPTVAMVIDGVVLGRPGMAMMDLMDVDRVEVLRGPQGTLFGKNASAGVINIVSKPIPKATEGYFDVGYYEKKETRVRFGIAGEMSPGVGGSVNVFAGKYDGNVKNVFLNETVNGYDRQGIRGKLQFTPNKDTTITVIGDYAKADDTGSRGPFVRTTTPQLTAAIQPAVASVTNRDVDADVKERVNDTNSGLSLQADLNFQPGTLTSITAMREWKNTQFQDIDSYNQAFLFGTVSLPNQSDRGDLKSKQTSQELRFASAKGSFVDYVAGFFYFNNKTDETYRRDVVRCATGAAALPNGLSPCATTLNDFGLAVYGSELKSTSFFGESTWNFAKDFRGILGLRSTNDKLSYYHARTSTQPAAIPGVQPTRPNTTGSTNTTGTSGRAGFQYDLSKDSMVYLTYSQGYKGPAYNVFFNMTATADVALNPEKSKGWEFGWKTTALDNKLRANLAVFNTKYTGYQTNYPDIVAGTVVTRFINAGDVQTSGAELDLQAKLSREFSISAAYASLKAEVDRFNCPPGATPAQCNIPSGTVLPFAPKRKGVIRANYKTDFAGYLTEFGTDYSWQSDTQYNLDASAAAFTTLQPAYGIWNASWSLANVGAGWRVTLVGKNLTNKSYSQFLISGANTQRSVPRDDKRYFGINVRYEF